jgi:hypothetical protein
MILRALERAYAMFTRTSFSLIPAVEVKDFNDATIKDYLDKFHSNMGLRHDFTAELQLNSDSPKDFNCSILNEATKVTLKKDGLKSLKDKGAVSNSMSFGALGSVTKDENDNPAIYSTKPQMIDSDWKKANDMVPSTVMVPVTFISGDKDDPQRPSTTVDIMVNIKAFMHRIPSAAMVENIVSTLAQKKTLLNFIKFVSGEEKSVADFLFGISQMKKYQRVRLNYSTLAKKF